MNLVSWGLIVNAHGGFTFSLVVDNKEATVEGGLFMDRTNSEIRDRYEPLVDRYVPGEPFRLGRVWRKYRYNFEALEEGKRLQNILETIEVITSVLGYREATPEEASQAKVIDLSDGGMNWNDLMKPEFRIVRVDFYSPDDIDNVRFFVRLDEQPYFKELPPLSYTREDTTPMPKIHWECAWCKKTQDGTPLEVPPGWLKVRGKIDLKSPIPDNVAAIVTHKVRSFAACSPECEQQFKQATADYLTREAELLSGKSPWHGLGLEGEEWMPIETLGDIRSETDELASEN